MSHKTNTVELELMCGPDLRALTDALNRNTRIERALVVTLWACVGFVVFLIWGPRW